MDYDTILEKSEICAEKTFNNTKKWHMEKFLRMQKKETNTKQQQEIDQNKWVVNMSSRSLTDTEERVLRRGLNFAPTPRGIPYIDMIAAVEGVARHLPNEEASELRGSVCGLLKRAKIPPSNMHKGERIALQNLRQDKNIAILPADKGNATVVMDAVEYERKMTNLLEDPIYKRVKRDPTVATERKVLKEVRELEKKELIPRNLGTRLKPSASTSPKLYGLPKIHKTQVPMRPIVSCIGSPTYNLAKYITTLISPLTGRTPSYIKNSQHFVKIAKDILLRPSEVMVSFDIKSLFTNVPVEEALQVVNKRLCEDETLPERTPLESQQVTHLLELCLKTTYFSFRGEFYQQKDGAAMGSPVSPVVANIYMEMFEQQALSTAPHAPRMWKRYVDDTFCIMEAEHVEQFLNYINNLRTTIKFTMEQEKEGSLPFLDTLLTREKGGKVTISIYRKPTHTDRYLHYSSHHPEYVKRGMATCLFHRARTIAVGDNIQKEEQHLRMVLRANDYPEHVIQAAAKPKKKRTTTTEEQPKYTICLPYIAGIGEDLRRVCRKYNIRTVFTTMCTIRRKLTNVKDADPSLKRSRVVYSIPCSCGLKYIGETKRNLETRLKEHQTATIRGETEKSAIAQHAWEEQHQPQWNNIVILDHARNDNILLIKEAIHITSAGQHSLLNRDQGTAIANCWRPFFKRVIRDDVNPPISRI